MGKFDIVITNNALKKMSQLRLSESVVNNVFNTGEVETKAGGINNSIKKFPGYEIGVMHKTDNTGKHIILSVWKRNRR